MSESAAAYFDERRHFTDQKFTTFQSRLSKANTIIDEVATVYATGSFGRREASAHSDIDLFILTDLDATGQQRLTNLNAISLQAALIDAAGKEGFPPFSDDGAYLKPHVLSDMRDKLGGRDDDYENLFTARILLLLESRPLLGARMHAEAIAFVLAEYWKDYDDFPKDFLPVYLANDIIRYWKVLCLNYEAKARRSQNPAKRKLDNYKLKHSRLMTCYSAVLYLCHSLHGKSSVPPEIARQMTQFTPVERLMEVAQASRRTAELVDDLLGMYVNFLQETDASKDDLLCRFADDEYHQKRYQDAQLFGDKMFDLVRQVGQPTPLFRYLVV